RRAAGRILWQQAGGCIDGAAAAPARPGSDLSARQQGPLDAQQRGLTGAVACRMSTHTIRASLETIGRRPQDPLGIIVGSKDSASGSPPPTPPLRCATVRLSRRPAWSLP